MIFVIKPFLHILIDIIPNMFVMRVIPYYFIIETTLPFEINTFLSSKSG